MSTALADRTEETAAERSRPILHKNEKIVIYHVDKQLKFKGHLKALAWLAFFVIVLEGLFLLSPLRDCYVAVYGPVLDLLHGLPATAWLTGFFLPQFSGTRGPWTRSLHTAGWWLTITGSVLFLGCAIPLYWSKIRRRGALVSGPYTAIRHPQYLTLAVLGLGAVLVWPRLIALVAYVTMLFFYRTLARWEEALCLARFGNDYRAYQARTGMFLPPKLAARLPRLLRRLVTRSASRGSYVGGRLGAS